jgi:hypothetical protein
VGVLSRSVVVNPEDLVEFESVDLLGLDFLVVGVEEDSEESGV